MNKESNSAMEDEKKALKRQFYEYCYEAKVKNTDNQDKIVIAISSALFGILLTLDANVFVDKAGAKCLLVALLISNALTLILSLLSLCLANKAIDRKIEIVKSFDYSQEKINTKNSYETIGKCLNAIYLFLTALTIILLAIMIGIIF